VDRLQERGEPWFYDHYSAVGLEYSARLAENSLQVVRECAQMMEATLNEYCVLGLVGESKLATISDVQLR